MARTAQLSPLRRSSSCPRLHSIISAGRKRELVCRCQQMMSWLKLSPCCGSYLVFPESSKEIYEFQFTSSGHSFAPDCVASACNSPRAACPQRRPDHERCGQWLWNTGFQIDSQNRRPSSTRRRPRRRPTPDADDYYDQGEVSGCQAVPKAIEAYKKATRLNPNHADAYYRLSWIYNEQGNTTGA